MARIDRVGDRTNFYSIGGGEGSDASKFRPRHITYVCGVCGNNTNGRIICDMLRMHDNAIVSWCVCTCEKLEPSILIEKDGQMITQLPNACEFKCQSEWPPELSALFSEAIKAYAAGAFTACTMVCRKLLMSCACHKGADDDKKFAYYVEYITNQVLTYPPAQKAIDAIREIGNEANHEIAFVGADDAKRAMKIVTYMLNTIYSFPAA